jgi:hypothetical protein
LWCSLRRLQFCCARCGGVEAEPYFVSRRTDSLVTAASNQLPLRAAGVAQSLQMQQVGEQSNLF